MNNNNNDNDINNNINNNNSNDNNDINHRNNNWFLWLGHAPGRAPTGNPPQAQLQNRNNPPEKTSKREKNPRQGSAYVFALPLPASTRHHQNGKTPPQKSREKPPEKVPAP